MEGKREEGLRERIGEEIRKLNGGKKERKCEGRTVGKIEESRRESKGGK
jgi:hypothetical protein